MSSTYLSQEITAEGLKHDSAPSGPRFERGEWSTDDMEQARSRLEAVYDGRQFRARRIVEPFAFRFASAGDSRLTIQTGLFLGHLQGVIPWSKDYVVSWFRSGSATIDYPPGQLESVGSRPFLTPNETSFSFSMTPHRHGIVHMDADFLEAVATERHGGPPQRIVFDYASIPTDDQVARWRRALGQTTPAIVEESMPPLARHSAQIELARALLDLFPWRAVDVPESVRTESTRRLRLALEYIHEHVDQPLTLADIAAVADVSTRTLQHAMNTALGTSPTAYLRNVRLDRARQDLLSATHRSARVSDVARHWGFGNLGRFSAAYLERFGEYPRTTLGA